MKPMKVFRRKRAARNGRAGRFSKHFRANQSTYQEMVPRFGLLILFIVAAVLLFPPTRRTKEATFKAGEIADRSIIAPFDFEVPLSAEDLKIQRASAVLEVLPVYVRDGGLETDLMKDLEQLFDSLQTVVQTDTLAREDKRRIAGSLFPYLSENMLKELVNPSTLALIRKGTMEYQRKLLARGFIDNAGPLRRRAYDEISVVDGSKESTVSAKEIVDQGQVVELIREEGFSRFQRNRNHAQVFMEIVRANLLPNLMLDSKETDHRREVAMDQVAKTIRIFKNQRIISKHDKVSVEQQKMLVALERARASVDSQRSPLVFLSLYTAQVMRLAIFGLLFGGYLFVFHRRRYDRLLQMGAIVTILLIYLVFSAAVVRLGLNPFLIPVVFVAMMITALFGYRLGLVATVFACFLIPLITDFAPHVGFVSLLAGTMAVAGLLRMRSRSHFYSVFLMVAGGYLIGVISTELGQVGSFRDLYMDLLWSFGNALFSSLAVMFLLPIFENIFSLTTRFTLLELTDLNKPILKRLNMEAPGTYHHSMLLGNLVDAVAPLIGADPLKARVMAYYHDIGKMFKPEYYVENQESGFNKHEKITPQMSSLILLSHVKDGVELAREEKLPDLIIDAIQQHHGTSVMAFFYQKALETDSHSSVNKDDFRYPGPRPTTKESAILMLADTVEPACRSLKDATSAHIRNMVQKLLAARAQEGELDDSGLTLNDLAKVREKYISILTGIYHKRVAYPGQEEAQEEEVHGEAVAKPL